jgi:hypothetical protein
MNDVFDQEYLLRQRHGGNLVVTSRIANDFVALPFEKRVFGVDDDVFSAGLPIGVVNQDDFHQLEIP